VLTPILDHLEKEKKTKINGYFSGPFLDRLQKKPAHFKRLKKLVAANKIELLAGLQHHSLSCLFSFPLFQQEVWDHQKTLEDLFDVSPKGFLNTAAIYSNDLARPLVDLGYDFAIVPRVPWFQGTLQDGTVFNAQEKGLSVILMDTCNGLCDHQVISVDRTRRKATGQWEDSKYSEMSCTEMVAHKKSDKIYSLPDTVALLEESHDLSFLVGNALQKQFLTKLKSLSADIFKCSDDLRHALLSLASTSCFLCIGQMDCLADLELRMGRD